MFSKTRVSKYPASTMNIFVKNRSFINESSWHWRTEGTCGQGTFVQEDKHAHNKVGIIFVSRTVTNKTLQINCPMTEGTYNKQGPVVQN